MRRAGRIGNPLQRDRWTVDEEVARGEVDRFPDRPGVLHRDGEWPQDSDVLLGGEAQAEVRCRALVCGRFEQGLDGVERDEDVVTARDLLLVEVVSGEQPF